MKVLWFASTPCSAAEKLGIEVFHASWLKSLEMELSDSGNLKLHVAFYFHKKVAPFVYNNTYYYPVYRKRRRTMLGRAVFRMTNSSDDKLEIPELLKVVNAVSPDVIHIHGTEENFGLLQLHTRIPVVISIQGIMNACVQFFYSGIPRQIATKYEYMLNKLLAVGSDQQYRNFRRRARRESKILASAKYVMGRTAWDQTLAAVMAPSASYYRGNEIMRPAFYTADWNEKAGEKVILITTLSDALYKGFEIIVETAGLLHGTGLDFTWNVIGVTEKSKVVDIVKKWKAADFIKLNIRLLGSKDDREIVPLICNAGIYCQVSHIENSANSLCEAMLLGIPVIASDCGGTSSLVCHSQSGLLFPHGDSLALAGHILQLVKDKPYATWLGKNGRDAARARHHKETVVKEVLNCYESIRNSNKI